MRASRIAILLVIAATMVLPAVHAIAQNSDQRLNLDFRDTPLKDILTILKRVGNLGDLTVPDPYGDKRITVSLVDKTVPEALTQVLDKAGLVAVNDGGSVTIKEKAVETSGRTVAPTHVVAQASIVRDAPRPTRNDSTASDVGTGTPLTPAAGQTAAQNKDKVYRIITTNFLNIEMISGMLGGSTISEDDYRNSGGSNGNGNNNGNNNGNSNGNNNNSSSNRSSSSSNRSSSSSSNRF